LLLPSKIRTGKYYLYLATVSKIFSYITTLDIGGIIVMDKKNRKDLDKYLQKFAVRGQEKLIYQLRQMLNPERDKVSSKSTESKKSSSREFIGRDKLFELMNTFRNETGKYKRPKAKNRYLYIELLCRPFVYPDNIDITEIKKYLQSDSTIQIGINDKLFNCITNQGQKKESFDFSIFVPKNGLFYTRNRSTESIQNKPDIFDPKIQSITAAGALVFLGRLYKSLGLNSRDRLDIAFRYNNAVDLAVGSIGPETFLPSVKFGEENLTFYAVRELHELLGQTAETTAVIIIELLKKLHYQGIVNKDFFVHAVSKYLAPK